MDLQDVLCKSHGNHTAKPVTDAQKLKGIGMPG